MSYWVNRFPVPPSINEQLASVGGRQIKTAKARMFDREIDVLRVKRADVFREITEAFLPHLKDHVIRVDQFFVFHESRVFTSTKAAKDWVKVIDHMNFQKSSQDALAKCLTIDDKFFFAGEVEKVSCHNPQDEQIIFRLSLMQPRTLTDVYIDQESGRIREL